jgi:hypothetical protein
MCNQCNDSNQEDVHALPSRREVLIAGAALAAAPLLGGVTFTLQAAQATYAEDGNEVAPYPHRWACNGRVPGP